MKAQSNCFSIYVSNEFASQGDTVELVVSVKGFENIARYKFSLYWIPSQLHYIAHSSNESPLMNQSFIQQNGVIKTSWADTNNQGVTLPDDAVLYKVKYRVLTSGPYFKYVKVLTYDNPGSIEVVDAAGKKLSYACVQGGARVNSLSTVQIDRICIELPACSGQTGKIWSEISGGMAPYRYEWRKPDQTYSDQQNIEQLMPGFYRFWMGDGLNETAEAVAFIPFDTSTVWVTSTTQYATCELPDGCAELNANGGQKPYVFSWQDGQSADSSRCDLPGGAYVVTVTDQVGCSAIFPFIVDKDTVLQVSLQPEFADCRFGELGKITPGIAGVGPFTFLWSTGDTTATLSNLKPGVYTVSVNNQIGCKGYAQVAIKDYGVFDWDYRILSNVDLDESASDLELQGYVVAQRARLPLSIAWDNGTRQEIKKVDESVTWAPLSHISALSNGDYAVTITDVDGCAQRVTQSVLEHQNQDLGPIQPQFYTSCDSFSQGDIKIWGRALKGIKKIKFGMECAFFEAQLDSITTNEHIAGLSTDCFSIYPFYRRIEFNWESPSPAGFEADSSVHLFTCHFGGAMPNPASFDFVKPVFEPILVENNLQEKVAFAGKGGYVFQGLIPSNLLDTNSFNLALPSCEYEGYRRIILHGSASQYPYAPYTDISYTQYPVPYIKELEWSDLFFLKPGDLFFSSHIARYALSVPPYPLPSTECVWPGDADNNSVVNHYDLLYLGLGMGHSYTPRTALADQWIGVESLDWPEATGTRAINFKNLDMDGNGHIEPADAAVLMQFWGEKTSDYDGRSAYVLPATPDSSADQINIGIEADTLSAGIEVKVPLSLSANGLHGLAFCISYDPKILVAAPRFEATNSWLGEPGGNLIAVQKDFPGQRRLDIALTRLDGQAAQGSGDIGNLVLTFKDLPEDSLQTTHLYVSNAMGIEPSERLVSLAETEKEIVLRRQLSSSTQELLSAQALVVSPNPARNGFQITSARQPISRVVLTDAIGAVAREVIWDTPAHTVQINTEGLLPGAYFAQVFVGQNMLVKKVLLR